MAAMNFEELKSKYAIPARISFKNKVKRSIKKLILKVQASKFIGENKVSSLTYGLLFTLKEKTVWKE